MFADRIIMGKTMVAIPTETKEQYDHVVEEIKALSNATNVDWGLIDDKYFNKSRLLCFAEGATVVALVFGSAIVISHMFNKRKNKTKEKQR